MPQKIQLLDNTNTLISSGNPLSVNASVTANPPASVVSTANSTTTLLNSGATFTGASESILAYGSISVQAYSDHASAASGLIIEQSQDGTNWDTTNSYTVSAATAFQQTVNAVGQYFRVVYTNGGTNQTVFRLQTIKEVAVSPAAGVSNQRVNAQSGDFVDGSLATLGAKADTAITDSTTTNTTQSFIKGFVKILADVWDSTNHLFHQNVKQVGGNAVSTAASGTQLVGVADGSGNAITSNSTTYTSKKALDANILGTLGTAFSTAGKVDTKAASGDFADGAIATLGLKADAKSTATDTTAVTIMQVLKEVSFMLQNPAALAAGTNAIGHVVNDAGTALIGYVGCSTSALFTTTQTAQGTGNSGDLDVSKLREITIDINITANVQGTNSTIQFEWDRKGADGIYYPIWYSDLINGLPANPTKISTSIGPGLQWNESLGNTGRLLWTVGGTATPEYTFTPNVYGK
jgi:hypothetical protein